MTMEPMQAVASPGTHIARSYVQNRMITFAWDTAYHAWRGHDGTIGTPLSEKLDAQFDDKPTNFTHMQK